MLTLFVTSPATFGNKKAQTPAMTGDFPDAATAGPAAMMAA